MCSILQESSTLSASKGETKQVHCTDHANKLFEQITSHFVGQQLFDVVLIAGIDKTRVAAHRLVLSACSRYFSAMFTGSLREATEKEVTLAELQGDILQALVTFCYSGRIELQHDTIEMLLVSASLLQIDSVVAVCSNFLAEQLDPSNCLGILYFADRHNCKELHKMAKEYCHEEFMKVCKHEEFLNLSATQLAELISSDDLNVPAEEDVYNSVMEWVNSSDLTNRKKHLRQLLPRVRMAQLSSSFIDNHMEAVCRSNDCLDLFIDALRWHSLPDKRQEMATENTKPRHSTSGTLFAIGASSIDKKIQIESYCPSSDKWIIWNTVNGTDYRNTFSVATMDDNLFILGGFGSSNQILNTVINMNLTTLAVTELTPMNTPRSGLGVAVVGKTLYAIGGSDAVHFLNTVERWNAVESTWNFVAPMSTKRRCPGVAVLDGCIYVVGGHNGSTINRTVECYNPSSNTWTERASMSVPRRNFGVTVSKGVLYAVGGLAEYFHPLSKVERYDPVADKWTTIEHLKMARGFGHCTFLDKCLIAVGGHDASKLVEQYDPEAERWCKRASLTRNCDTVGIFVVSNRYMSKLAPPTELEKQTIVALPTSECLAGQLY